MLANEGRDPRHRVGRNLSGPLANQRSPMIVWVKSGGWEYAEYRSVPRYGVLFANM